MQADYASQLTLTLSSERLDAYRGKPPQPISNIQLFGRYAWNMALSEALYPSLQILEIALRNTLHQAATAHFGQADWFDMSNVLQHQHERDAVQRAKIALSQQRKPHDASRIVAELNFGFWTSLFDKRYEQTLWPRLLIPAFPHMPRGQRTRSNLSAHFTKIRRLRNRVFHHEPIWHWHDLALQHLQIQEAIAWIEPAAYDLTKTLDRFPAVHGQSSAPLEQALRAFC